MNLSVKLQFPAAVTMKSAIFSVVKPCSSELTRRFGEIYACMFKFEEEVKQGTNRRRHSLLSDFNGFLFDICFYLSNWGHMFSRNVGLSKLYDFTNQSTMIFFKSYPRSYYTQPDTELSLLLRSRPSLLPGQHIVMAAIVCITVAVKFWRKLSVFVRLFRRNNYSCDVQYWWSDLVNSYLSGCLITWY
jgi:hypothetical protein